MTSAEYIRHARDTLKLSQSELAKLLGYQSRQPIGDYERGKREPSVRVLKLIQLLLKQSEVENGTFPTDLLEGNCLH